MVHLFSSPEYAKFWVFSGTCVSLANSHCHSVGFCVAFCAVPVLISWAIRSKAYISTAKYKHLSLFWKLCWNYFCWEQNEMEKNWWRKCQGGKGTSVPVKIQIWVWHCGITCSQIFCILPALPLLCLPSLWLKTENTLTFLKILGTDFSVFLSVFGCKQVRGLSFVQ